MKKLYNIVLILCLLMAFPANEISAKEKPKKIIPIVHNFAQLQEASFQIVCRTKLTKQVLGGGSASMIYHKPEGSWVLVTAGHVTVYCRDENGKLALILNKDLRDKDGYVYKNQQIFIDVKEIGFSGQHDLSVVETKRKFKKQAPYFKVSKIPLKYSQTVWSSGYPGPFRSSNTLILTKGSVNSPDVPYPSCIIDEFEKNRVLWDCAGYEDSEIFVSIILTDSDIGPGNSGGGLLNSKLELVGVTVAAQRMGNWRPMSIPMKYLMELIDKTPYRGKI